MRTGCAPAASIPHRWRVAGGATRNAALVHACCDALGRPLDVMPHAGAAIGPAALALRAAGARWQPSPERTIEPDAARSARFAALLGTYRGAYAGLAPTMHDLAEAGALHIKGSDPFILHATHCAPGRQAPSASRASAAMPAASRR